MKNKTKLLHIIAAAIFILLIAVDQITKKMAAATLMKGDVELIPGIFSLHYLENRGAAWGIFQNAFWLFYIITAVVLVAMVIFYSRIPFTKNFHLLRFAVLLLCAGAIGNFIDRAVNHYVIDFIYVECIHFPVFNIADCYVCIAAILLLYCLLIKYKDEELVWKK